MSPPLAPSFEVRAAGALADATLKPAIDRTAGTAERKRTAAVDEFPEYAAARARGARIKDHVLEHLAHYLEAFERNATAAGATVHWARTADEACGIVVDLCKAAGARRVTRAKSMLGEEIGLPHALSAAGIERLETDLAEHIVQLADDVPSHIVWPAMHKTREQVEVLVPSIEHAGVLLRLLVRSATGGDFTQYTTFHCGPKREGDADGPEEMHIVLVDNGRTRMLRDGMQKMLRCIRCGACMNHCVVYRHIGGHAYGGTYPGPMGAVLTPVFDGLAKSRDLPQACTLNGKCREVCPVDIPLPTLLRGWRDKSWREGLEPRTVRAGIGAWAWVARHPSLYRLVARSSVAWLRLFARGGRIRRMPFTGGWTGERDFPAPARSTFMNSPQARARRS